VAANPFRILRLGAAALVLAGCLLAAPALAAGATPANPCELVPASVIARAFGVKKPPASTLSSVTNASTCSYKGGLLTVSVGSTALTNTATPLKESKVPGLANGIYETYEGSSQTEVTFYRGSANSGLYAVVRNFGHISGAKLAAVARALSTALASAGSAGPGGALLP
jgi:hypothetical protein